MFLLNIQSEESQLSCNVDFDINGFLYLLKQIPLIVTNNVATIQNTINKFVDEEVLLNTVVYLGNITIVGKYETEHDINV